MDELFDDDDLYDFDDEDEDDDDYDFDDENPEYEVTCPKCGEVVVVDENTLLEGETSCPKCGRAWNLNSYENRALMRGKRPLFGGTQKCTE